MRTSLFEPFVDVDLPLPERRDGKVRASRACGDQQRLIVTTDRLSAFDRILAGVPFKGQVLNQLAAWWFEQVGDLVDHHVISVPDQNAVLAREARPLPVEVVVRGHITGVTDTSLWGMYAEGERDMYGYSFPDGLRKNTALPAHIVTPTTKAQQGGHDEPLSCAEVVERGLLPAALWDRIMDAALAVFARGVQVGADAGLILADTKYEFGLTADDQLILIDEVHTPDSSRWWMADSYEHRVSAGHEPESLDKEVVRRALADAGYTGEGPIPELSPAVWSETSARYIDAYERLTGATFTPGTYPAGPRIHAALAGLEIN